jgi:hypothetical protein
VNAEASHVIVAGERTPKREGNAVSVPAMNDAAGIMAMIANAARDPNVDPDKMLKLYDIRERELNRLAKAAFADAMATFKANPPKIVKDKHVKIAHKNGGGFTEYDHATLGHVCDQIIAGLAAVGISHRWDLAQLDGGMIRVTCVLTHRDGHSEGTALLSSRDESGSKNNIQAVGSTVTYLQRYTLLSSVGLATGLPDDDGHGSEGGNDYERITDSQVADLKALIQEVGANTAALLTYIKYETLADIPADRYRDVVRVVEGKRKGARK